MVAANLLNGLVEVLQKTGSVTLLHRRRATGDLSAAPEFRQEVASRKSVADIVLGESSAGWTDRVCSRTDAAARERNVVGDDDVLGLYMLRDPVISDVQSLPNHFESDPRLSRNSHPGIRHQGDTESAAPGDTVNLFLDRTGISIDQDVQHLNHIIFGATRAHESA